MNITKVENDAPTVKVNTAVQYQPSLDNKLKQDYEKTDFILLP